MRYPPPHTQLDGTTIKAQSPPHWATAPRPVLPPNAPTAGYLCGGGGIMTAGFETAGIRSLWNIDQDPSDPILSQAIAQIYQTNFHHPVIRQTLQKTAASDRFNDLPTPSILVLTQPCKHLSKSNPKAKETQSDIDTATAAIIALQTFRSPALIIENVPSYQQSASWQLVKTALIDLDYQFTAKILNTADFAIPQQRHRFLTIAIKSNLVPTLPQPTTPHIGWYEAIADLLPHLEDIHPTKTQLQRIATLPSHFLQQPLLIERVGAYSNPKVRLPHETCWTIRKSIWLDQRHNSRANAINIRLPDGNWKNLGIRGAARLMTLPDWFWLPDEAWISGSAIGNGVPSLLAATLANFVKPYLTTAYPADISFSHKKVEVALAAQERTSNKHKNPIDILTQNQPTESITMQATANSAKLDNYNFPPLTSSQTIALATEVIQMGNTHAAELGKVKEQSLELGYKLLELETALGESELKELLKHCFSKEIVRYYRNILAQAKLLEKCPQLYDKILEIPICHTAILLAGTEEQIVQILTSDTKWTVELLKERLKADNSSPALPIPEIAVNAPVKIIADAPGYSGEIAIVQNITNGIIATKLHSGEVGEFHISEVKPLCPDTYIELITILATSNSLHASFKAAADSGDERLQNDIENKLSKLDKCRRQLIARLGLTDKAAKNLATYATASISVEEIATQENCNRTWRVWNIVEDDREPIIAKAQLLAKLRTKQILAQPTLAELAIACATILHKSTTKHSGGGIPISTREYSELTELVQEKDSTIQQLKVELDNVKALQGAAQKDTEAPISDRLDDMQQEMESLRQSYQSIEQKYSRAMTELESYKQLVEKQADEIDSLKNSNPSVATTPPIFQPNDIVRIVENPNNALVNEIGIFKEVEIEDTICGSREKAVVVLKPGTKFQFPARIGNYQQSLAKIQLTPAEFKLLVEAEELARQNQDLTESVNYKEEKIDSAVCQIGGCLDRLGVPGWYEKGVYIDSQGNTYSDGRALSLCVEAIAEILANITSQPSYSEQPDEDIEF